MYESARLYITIGIDMEIRASSGNTAFDIFTVIPEVYCKQRFCFSEFPYLAVHVFSLFICNHKLRHSVNTDRHICEKPAEFCAPRNHLVVVFFGSYGLVVLAGIAAGNSKRQLL